MADTELRIRLSAQDTASPVLRRVVENVQGAVNQIARSAAGPTTGGFAVSSAGGSVSSASVARMASAEQSNKMISQAHAGFVRRAKEREAAELKAAIRSIDEPIAVARGEKKAEAESKGFLRGMKSKLGEGSTAYMAAQVFRGAGPAAVIGVAARLAARYASEAERVATAFRMGEIHTSEMADQFVRTVPLVGDIYSTFASLFEVVTGISAGTKRILEDSKNTNTVLDARKRIMEDAAASQVKHERAMLGVGDRFAMIGASPSERAAIERGGRLRDVTNKAADERKKRNDEIRKDAQVGIEAAKALEASMRQAGVDPTGAMGMRSDLERRRDKLIADETRQETMRGAMSAAAIGADALVGPMANFARKAMTEMPGALKRMAKSVMAPARQFGPFLSEGTPTASDAEIDAALDDFYAPIEERAGRGSRYTPFRGGARAASAGLLTGVAGMKSVDVQTQMLKKTDEATKYQKRIAEAVEALAKGEVIL